MLVREIMSTDVSVAEPEDTVESIATIMKSEGVGAIPVVDEENDLTGILTDRDIVIRCIAEGRDPSECTAQDILSAECEVCSPEEDVQVAAERMAARQIRRLPVVEDGRLIGMVSLGDIAVKHGDDEVTGETLEEVSKGVTPARRASADSSARTAAETHLRDGRQAGGSRGIAAGESRRAETVRSTMPGNKAEERTGRQQQALKSDSSPKKQGISNHPAKEENRRQDNVVPFRADNAVRNKHAARPKKKEA
jgi:CBS domain-containing protein